MAVSRYRRENRSATIRRALAAKGSHEGMLNQDVLKKPWYRWYALFILLMVYTSSHVDRQIMGILLEPSKWSSTHLTPKWVLGGPYLRDFLCNLGHTDCDAGDRSNRRNIIAIATAIWSGMTAFVLVGSYSQLALARIGVGIGSRSSPPSHSMISDLFPSPSAARRWASLPSVLT